MSLKYYKISWNTNEPIKDNINYENYNDSFELCIEFIKKQVSEQDCIYSKYDPKHLLKYPININRTEYLKDGKIYINSTEFNNLIKHYDISNFYILQSKYEKNNINSKKIKINTDCINNECNLLKNIRQYKKLDLKINTNCNDNTKCDYAILSFNK